MRKSGLKPRSRRGKGIILPPSNGSSNDGFAIGNVESASSGIDMGEKRKPTTEEAALSARNNRLAKELVGLRRYFV